MPLLAYSNLFIDVACVSEDQMYEDSQHIPLTFSFILESSSFCLNKSNIVQKKHLSQTKFDSRNQ